MSLHHFYWRGKERTVSIDKRKDNITLRFIDQEIIDAIGSHLLQIKRDENFAHESSLVQEIVLAVKEVTKVI